MIRYRTELEDAMWARGYRRFGIVGLSLLLQYSLQRGKEKLSLFAKYESNKNINCKVYIHVLECLHPTAVTTPIRDYRVDAK